MYTSCGSNWRAFIDRPPSLHVMAWAAFCSVINEGLMCGNIYSRIHPFNFANIAHISLQINHCRLFQMTNTGFAFCCWVPFFFFLTAAVPWYPCHVWLDLRSRAQFVFWGCRIINDLNFQTVHAVKLELFNSRRSDAPTGNLSIEFTQHTTI